LQRSPLWSTSPTGNSTRAISRRPEPDVERPRRGRSTEITETTEITEITDDIVTLTHTGTARNAKARATSVASGV